MFRTASYNPVATILLIAIFAGILHPPKAGAVYHASPHRAVPQGAVPVSEPGMCDRPGTTYMLTRDISSPVSALFLGSDVTLDLNGYTISYASGGYGHVPNYGFENGLDGWDVSKAPGAKIEDDKVHVFIGRNILRLAAGDEIVSGYVNLPVTDRSYFAMCGVTVTGMKISLYVEDSDGETVKCTYSHGDSTSICCPVEEKTVRLGGGFVTAHLHDLPAGNYRVRVRAETDCLIDHVDIRPAMDVGIGIVGRTYPWCHTDDFFEWKRCAFFDNTVPGTVSEPLPGIPVVTTPGTITIKNGIIRSDTRGILSWGIQSTAENTRVILENVRIVTSGINTNAVDIPFAKIADCRFEVDTPFIINRHASEHAVVLRGIQASEVFGSEFIGGQGCLTIRGKRSHVHDNFFVNRQTVTNHYCVMAAGDSSMIYSNRFEPEIGSGVEIYVHKYIEIFDNVFRIEAAPPTCEYGHEDYSVNAIRVADYRAEPGSENSCAENRIYGNTFFITGRDYPEYPDYIPMAYGIFHSVSGGNTYYYDNDFYVDFKDPGSKAECAACYIVGNNGGMWYNNRITTNTHAFWLGTRYGNLKHAELRNNTVIKSPGAPENFSPVRIGWSGRNDVTARGIFFRSNDFINTHFTPDMTDQDHEFRVFRTLTVTVHDTVGSALPDREVTITDNTGGIVFAELTNDDGEIRAELEEYIYSGGVPEYRTPYTVKACGVIMKTELERNTNITLQAK